ncbi:hypothetical protein NDU88_003468 [Pleurodeles waltl]|uniref:Uncharacterized protein n=1 Tax=Pleurodeles waltl TaxID=8319 RepID=A0AAV7NGS2_PLEWA|nr:hypothetical protein NDU88_003468 [Pleurodeles waltl]
MEGKEINIYPDYTNQVQKQRAAFVTAKKVFRQNDIKYALQYPAKRRRDYEKQTHFLGTPLEAWEQIEMRGLCQVNGHGQEGVKTWSTSKKKSSGEGLRQGPTATPSQEKYKTVQKKAVKDLRETTEIQKGVTDGGNQRRTLVEPGQSIRGRGQSRRWSCRLM